MGANGTTRTLTEIPGNFTTIYPNETAPIITGKISRSFQPVLSILVSVQAAFGIYLLISMFYAEWKWRDRSSSKAKRDAKLLRRVCLIATMIGVVHFTITEFTIFVPQTVRSCMLRLAAQKLSYCLGIFTVYIFLWLRQKLFYSNPSLKDLYTKCYRLISWSVIVIIILCFLCQTTMTVIGVLLTEKEGNHDKPGCANPLSWVWTAQIVLGAATSLLVHISLMCLFVYPLVKHRLLTSSYFVRGQNGSFVSRTSVQLPATPIPNEAPTCPKSDSLSRKGLKLYREANPDETVQISRSKEPRTPINVRKSLLHASIREMKQKRDDGRVRTLIKRCFILASVCVITSLTATILTAIFYHGGLLAPGLYGTNMLINLLCCAGCFSNWRRMVLPFCQRKLNRSLTELSTTNRQCEVQRHESSRHSDSVV